MRRRRKTKYTWFPQLGAQGDTPEDDTCLLPIDIPQVIGGASLGVLSDVTIIAIIPDRPQDTPTATQDHLDDFIASEYLLKRIVGKFQVHAPGIDTTSATNGIIDFCVAAGFFIARAERTSGADVPIGAATAVERKENYGPLALQNVREPWIWRRTWCMSTIGFKVPVANNLPQFNEQFRGFPQNNSFGSVAEGAHIDAKTARRVGNDDRLFFAVQTIGLSEIGTSVNMDVPNGFLDVRLLGALRKAKGRSAF